MTNELQTKDDYLDRLSFFEACWPDFNASLSEFIADQILRFGRQTDGKIRLLDVGSSAGTLLTEVLRKIAPELDVQDVLALEPDHRSFSALAKNEPLKSWNVRYALATLEEVMRSKSPDPLAFNVVLLSHVLYHFSEPAKTIETLRTRNGSPCLVIAAHDSHEGQLYRFADHVRSFRSLEPTERYGNYSSAEQLRAEFAQHHLAMSQVVLRDMLSIGTCAELADLIGFLGRRRIRSGLDIHDVCQAAPSFGIEIPGEYPIEQIVFFTS